MRAPLQAAVGSETCASASPGRPASSVPPWPVTSGRAVTGDRHRPAHPVGCRRDPVGPCRGHHRPRACADARRRREPRRRRHRRQALDRRVQARAARQPRCSTTDLLATHDRRLAERAVGVPVGLGHRLVRRPRRRGARPRRRRRGDGFLADMCRQWEGATGSGRGRPASASPTSAPASCSPPKGGALKKQLPLFKLGPRRPVRQRHASGRAGSPSTTRSAAIEHLLTRGRVAAPVNLTAPNPVTNAEFTKALGTVLQPTRVAAHPLVRAQAPARRRARRRAAVHRPAGAARP